MRLAVQIALLAFMVLYFGGAIGAKNQRERVTYFAAGLVLAVALIVSNAVWQ